VTVIEYASAFERSLLGTDPNTHGPAGSASDGLGDAPTVYGNGYVSSGYHALAPQDGSSGTIALIGVKLNAQNPLYSVTSGYPGYTSWPGGQTAVSLSVILPPPLQAHSTVDSANWDPTRPRFFSGTNCSVSGTATAYSAPPGNNSYPAGGTYVKQARLSIGGMMVKEYDDTNSLPSGRDPNVIYLSGTNQASISIPVIFDSTHFADNSPISIQMTVTDSGGLTYMVPINAKAYNKAYVLGNDKKDVGSLDQGRLAAQDAAGQFNVMNHVGVPYMADQKPDILKEIPFSTVFYIYTHANNTAIGDCWATPSAPDNHILFAYSDPTGVYSVATSVGTKTVTQPAYNLIFIEACSAAQYGDFARAFGIVPSSIDQAYFGFTTLEQDSPNNENWSKQVLTDMASGYTIKGAINEATQSLGPPQYFDNSGAIQTAVPYVWGDDTMKLHGVYGGLGSNWFL